MAEDCLTFFQNIQEPYYHMTTIQEPDAYVGSCRELIAKVTEEKMSGEHGHLLNEHLKAIKKELGLETDDETAATDLYLSIFRERC